jgi:hypothetical protein
MHPVERYLRHLREIRATGAAVPETSYYPALSNLLNEVGETLRPRVHCVINLQNRGAGLPDGGLFTPEQLHEGEEIIAGQRPSRGAIEDLLPAATPRTFRAARGVASVAIHNAAYDAQNRSGAPPTDSPEGSDLPLNTSLGLLLNRLLSPISDKKGCRRNARQCAREPRQSGLQPMRAG